MQAATHAPSHSQALSYSDSSDEDEKKRAVCSEHLYNKIACITVTFYNFIFLAYYWKKSSIDEFVPANAVVAGRDLDGSLIYIGKAKHNGDKLPAKIIPQRRYAAVSYGGQEHSVQNYKVFLDIINFQLISGIHYPIAKLQILCEHTLKWIPNANGNVPEGAVVGGKTESGEKLYIGRASVNGTVTVGKV